MPSESVRVVERPTLVWAWRCSLGFFVLAGLTGSLYRFAPAYGWETGLELTNIRHAHSHFMYFGWATPALFALIGHDVLKRTHSAVSRSLSWILIGAFAAAFSAYPLFMAFGYSPVRIGDTQMPIAVISSTLNMVAWYAFLVFYVRRTRDLERDAALQLWDIALVFLVLATLGAGGLAVLKPLGIEDPAIASALTHVFLDFFSEGWFVLGVLGLAAKAHMRARTKVRKGSLYLLCAGLPLTFAQGMPSILVPDLLKVLAGVGGVLVGTGLLWITLDVLRDRGPETAEVSRKRGPGAPGALRDHRRGTAEVLREGAPGRFGWVWLVPLGFLAIKALGQIAVSAFPSLEWSSMFGLRILYLHTMLLGFVTLGLAAAAGYAWSDQSGRALYGRYVLPVFYVSVGLVMLSLLMLTPLLPVPWSPFKIAAWVSLLPVAAAAWMVVGGGSGRQVRL